jgi:maternal embryonic leucine zipper kinase
LKRLFRQIALAVQHLHQQGIAHSDIKPENAILDIEDNAKLIDFGFAKQKQIAGDDEKYGTPIYMPPELLRTGSYDTQKADIWSLGILLYKMSACSFPYPSDNDIIMTQMIKQGKLIYPDDLDSETEGLIKKLTRLNPNERPTIDAILQDSFFDELLFDGSAKPAINDASPSLLKSAAEEDMDLEIW